MSEKPSESHDVRTIHHLVRLMKRYDLTALDFIDGPTKIRLRRQGPESGLVFAQGQAVPPVLHPAAPQAPSAPRPEPAAPAAPTTPETVIESPMVGTFYSSSAPDAPPFVSVGTVVRPDSTVCVIEAMKVFTDIPAGVSGTVTAVLVKNGQPVEYGQPLFRVNPT